MKSDKMTTERFLHTHGDRHRHRLGMARHLVRGVLGGETAKQKSRFFGFVFIRLTFCGFEADLS